MTNAQVLGQASDDIVTLENVTKTYETLDATITAVDEVTLRIAPGTVVALTGASGSGKSTLLHLIGALDVPDAGSIVVAGQCLGGLRRRQLAEYRRRVGFVFQQFNLIPTLTVLDNVTVPTMTTKHNQTEVRERARSLLERVGLEGREHTLATRLSGGQQQRVAIARALINHPTLILADEPTGNLDSATAQQTIDLLLSLRDDYGTTFMVATHDPGFAARCDRSIIISDGRVTTDTQISGKAVTPRRGQ